jgi:hypothetical protein
VNSSKVEYAVETWGQCGLDIEALGRAHFEEVDGGVEPNREYGLAHDLILAAEKAGGVKCMTARKGGVLVGYITWNISPDLESFGRIIATQGAWYASTDAGFCVGYRLYKQSLDFLKGLGVKQVFPHHRLQGRGKKLGKFFQRLGAKEIQHTYSLWL